MLQIWLQTWLKGWLKTGLLRAAAVAATVLLASLPAAAHPHIWVTMEATLLYENGVFTGIRHKWTFDEYYTASAIEGLDKNKDGIYDREELAELAKVNVDALKDFDYFTFPTLAGQAVKLGEPKDYWLEHKDGALSLLFTVPFATPVLPDAKGFAFAVYDPSFFIAFDLAKSENPGCAEDLQAEDRGAGPARNRGAGTDVPARRRHEHRPPDRARVLG
jgi:ABC-type uncharacterized transport system substrate-binding protein